MNKTNYIVDILKDLIFRILNNSVVIIDKIDIFYDDNDYNTITIKIVKKYLHSKNYVDTYDIIFLGYDYLYSYQHTTNYKNSYVENCRFSDNDLILVETLKDNLRELKKNYEK